MEALRLPIKEEVTAGESNSDAAAKDQGAALEAHGESVAAVQECMGRPGLRLDNVLTGWTGWRAGSHAGIPDGHERLRFIRGASAIQPQERVDGARDRESEPTDFLANKSHTRMRCVTAHRLPVRYKECIPVLKLYLLRVKKVADRPQAEVLVVAKVAVAQVQVVAEKRRQRPGEKDVVCGKLLWKSCSAVLDVMQERKLPEAECAAEEDARGHDRCCW